MADRIARWGRGRWNVDTWGNWGVGLVVGNHRFRLMIRWYDREDLFPTYYTLWAKEPTYQTTLDNYSSYQDLLDNVGGGVEADEDITCDLSGLTLSGGRDNSLAPMKAAVMRFSLNDPDGLHDPRKPPLEARTRTGSRVRLECKPQDTGDWVTLFTGWVESWEKALTPNAAEVDVECSDAFNMMARAVPSPTDIMWGWNQPSSAHIQHALDAIPWNDKWGVLSSYAGGYPCNNHLWDGEANVLDYLHDIVFVEDGFLAVAPDGTIRAEAEGWRAARTYVLGVSLIPNDERPWVTEPDDIVCPSVLDTADDDLDLLNRVTVWRSVEYDPDVGDPPAPPNPDKRSAEDVQSMSYHGVAAHQWTARNASNTRSQQLADMLVGRYAEDRNDIGDVEMDLMKRPEDARPFVTAWFGDTVVVRDTIGDTYLEQSHEVVGYEHRLTPYRWEGTLILDRKVT